MPSSATKSASKSQSLRLYLGLGLIAWVATFLMVHGPDVILSYLAIQIVTSGIFAFFMWKTEKKIGATGISDSGDNQTP
ncbi:MAG: hypothetical protein O2820_14045 [Planctomycetota bacterium]|nr:hypothetical protein [Planctomycetota bacterium]MDA1250334.1 hypothetical protein [Planctomycetota bacterium]